MDGWECSLLSEKSTVGVHILWPNKINYLKCAKCFKRLFFFFLVHKAKSAHRNSHIYVNVVLCDLILQGYLMRWGSGVQWLKSDLVCPFRSTTVLPKPLLTIGLTPNWPKKKSFGETVNESLMTVW